MNKFNINNINFSADDLEQLGTKEKFWFIYQSKNLTKWLFKYSRVNTGEHWSEKVAEQFCEFLDIPHVEYELAESNGRLGVITKNIVPGNCRMVMGNEVLHTHSPNVYPQPERDNESFVRVKEHTVNRVIGTLDLSKVLPPITKLDIGTLNAGDIFCGYLMLDTLISNQDRHHENWAIIINNETGVRTLCPTYDHAASLGRELLDKDRSLRLETKDNNRKVEAFVLKSRSELFNLKTDKKPLKTIDAFLCAIAGRDEAKKHWFLKLKKLSENKIIDIFHMVPDEVITPIARKFAIKMVLENKRRLLQYEKT